MFGKINTYYPELKMKDDEAYRGYYCGLCEALGNYGVSAKLLLSYDCSFLYILMSGLNRQEESIEKKRCLRHPLGRKVHIKNSYADFCAAANILLGSYNLKDKIEDGQSIIAKGEYALLRKAERKASERFPKLEKIIGNSLEKLSALEKEKSSDIDKAADTFAGLLGELFTAHEDFSENRVLREFGYQLGRWIYLLDAYEDREKDKKSGNYNVFNLKFDNEEELKESARFNIFFSLNQAVMAYDLLKIENNRDLLDNIVQMGLNSETIKVLDGKKNESI